MIMQDDVVGATLTLGVQWVLGTLCVWSVLVANVLSVCAMVFFFFNAPAPTEIYTLSLHDALPIFVAEIGHRRGEEGRDPDPVDAERVVAAGDRKSTRLNSSHLVISYAVFCLK